MSLQLIQDIVNSGDGPREAPRDGSRQINQTSRCRLSELFRIIKSTVYLELKVVQPLKFLSIT